MKIESKVRILTGTLLLLGLTLAYVADPGWLALAAFVGVNLVLSAFTGWCPVELLLRRRDPHDRPPAGRRATGS